MSSSPEDDVVWAALGPESLLEVLAPLAGEHRRSGAVQLIADEDPDVQTVAARLPGRRTTLLVIEDPGQPTRRGRYTSPYLKGAQGADVLVGWVRLEARDLAAYAQRATALLRRPADPELPLVLLAPRERRYLTLLDELEQTASSLSALATYRWSAERIARWSLVHAVRCGAAAALYTGHGNGRGWLAYGGLSAEALAGEAPWADDDTTALLLALTCRNAAPARSSSSDTRSAFADHAIGRGVAGAVFAAVGDPRHDDDRRLAHALVRALGEGHRCCRDLLDAVRAAGVALTEYAVIGDPALTAAPSRGAGDRCRRVFAPAPNAVISADGDRGRNVGVTATYEPRAAVVADAGDGVHVDRRSRPQDDKR